MRKPLQHKTVAEVAGEAVGPVEQRMAGMEDWLTSYTQSVMKRFEALEAGVRRLETPWYVRLGRKLGLR